MAAKQPDAVKVTAWCTYLEGKTRRARGKKPKAVQRPDMGGAKKQRLQKKKKDRGHSIEWKLDGIEERSRGREGVKKLLGGGEADRNHQKSSCWLRWPWQGKKPRKSKQRGTRHHGRRETLI